MLHDATPAYSFLRCSAGVQDASVGLDMMKENCSGHISLI